MGKYEIERLPDVEMYGGDTRPWVIVPLNESGHRFFRDIMEECVIVLTVTPFKMSTGLGKNAVKAIPILKIRGTIDEDASIRFSFSSSDTIKMRGRYVYQIEVRHDTDMWSYQGKLYIKQNIHQNYVPHTGSQFDDLPLSKADSLLLSGYDDTKFTDIFEIK